MKKYLTLRVVGPGIEFVGSNSLAGHSICEISGFVRVLCPAPDYLPAASHCEATKRHAATRVEVDRGFEVSSRLGKIVFIKAPQMPITPNGKIPGIEVLRCLALKTFCFGGNERWCDGSGDRFCNLVLHGKYVVQVAIITLRPNMVAGKRVNQLRRDAYAVATFPNAALEDVPCSKFLANHANIR